MIKREIIQRYDDIVKELQMDGSILRTIDQTLEQYIEQLKMNQKIIRCITILWGRF